MPADKLLTAEEARRLLAALDAKCPMCGATPLHPIHASTCGVFQVADLAATVIALSERDAATDAWLAEIGHLSLAAAGVELAHLRGVEKERDRIRLRVLSIRVERVNAISEADARAEGCDSVAAFAALWDGLYGAGSFDRGDWCWVTTFERVEVPSG